MTGPEPAHVRELRRRLRAGWWVLLVSFVCAFLAAATSMVYANKVAHESERKWCGVVVAIDDAYREAPPETPTGRRIAADIRRLRSDFGCPR